jgi:hypothetical protein
VDDALLRIAEPVELDLEVARVALDLRDLRLVLRVEERPAAVGEAGERRRRVVGRRENACGLVTSCMRWRSM